MATTAVSTRRQAAQHDVIGRKQRSLWRDAVWRLFRNRAAIAGLAVIVFAAFVAITRPASHVGDVMPVVIGGLAGVAAAMWLFRASTPQLTEGQMTREPLRSGPVRHGHGGTRRRTR